MTRQTPDEVVRAIAKANARWYARCAAHGITPAIPPWGES